MLTVQINNIDELYRKIGEMTLRGAFRKAMNKSGMLVERNAKLNTPVITGVLRNSYETKIGDYQSEIRNFREYAPKVESRRGFMKETAEESKDEINEIFITEINQLLETLGN